MELNDLFKKANNASQFYELDKEEGFNLTEEVAGRAFEEMLNTTSGELSEDELLAVSGGRDYPVSGCAATVEFGSSCWGTDGGCARVNIRYNRPPLEMRCPRCGAQTVYQSHTIGSVVFYGCASCSASFHKVPGKDVWKIN